MKKITVSAPGKLHLLGEHTVVYGKPAIIAAVDRRCFVTINPRSGNKISIVIPAKSGIQNRDWSANQVWNNNYEIEFSTNQILEKTKSAQHIWKKYIETNDIAELKAFTLDPINFVAIAIGETLHCYNKKKLSGCSITIQSDVPIGSGMGSSAAVAVAMAGAVTELLGEPFDKEKINEIAYFIEQKKHGMPSGGDNAASCYGGLIWYQKKSDKEKIITPLPYSFPKKLVEKFLIINTGIPEESTGEMVTKVKSRKLKVKSQFESIFDNQEKLVYELLSVIQNKDVTSMIRIIRAGEENLEELRVVSESTKKIIREIEKAGGAAKICGAGGKKNASGIVLAFHKDPDMIKNIGKQFGLSCKRISLGEKGVKREQ